MIAETSYQIGKTALSKGQRGCAVTWLKRALEHAQGLPTLTTPHQTQGRDTIELKLLAGHALARAYMFIKTPESQQSLTEQLDVLKRDHGNNPAVLFLELEVLGHNVKPKLDHYFQGKVAPLLIASAPDLIF
ncbi:hypothetical protein NUU61_010142 [Penicillium alfredii]|uniref:Uncharacterized protein n=1 Tax=Penicillium alfredii TaxID=1506179 RepID=A0A9W9EHF2_9EURO|nr:uncharacterized protein NUU61_010142 [Penicillium alfredii]KAJ5081878.1 hypothetical protein NUU61_010142 [Penicillium alfredii]